MNKFAAQTMLHFVMLHFVLLLLGGILTSGFFLPPRLAGSRNQAPIHDAERRDLFSDVLALKHSGADCDNSSRFRVTGGFLSALVPPTKKTERTSWLD
jgi:hypothetical protein